MSKRSLQLCVVGLFLVAGYASAPLRASDLYETDPGRYEELRVNAFLPLFEALQTGDVVYLRNHLEGDTLRRYRVLLEENTEYGGFLRDHYEDTAFELLSITERNGRYVGQVTVHWADGRSAMIYPEVSGRDLLISLDPSLR